MIRTAGRNGWPGAHTASGRFIGVVQERSAEIERLFAAQQGVADSFNIVLFGRTGAGKSTLIETFTRGTGEPVSQGESDWTVDVAPKVWNSCKIYDTPGTNGWGRKNKRADLERKARYAVEVADFVIICFDTQSQQEAEFEKVAEWVRQFNKPVIAVLNSRNAIWRLPARVKAGAQRANMSLAVAQHAGNIEDELAAIGLPRVPVVAIASKRALFARASLPFVGPDRETLEQHRALYGVKKLEAWSNFLVLEGLLVRCIAEHAVTIRLAALNDQLRGVLDTLAAGMLELEESACNEAAIIETQTVGALLKLFGYPITQVQREPYHKNGVDQLALLEKFSGRFQSPSVGEFEVFVQQRLTTELGILRSRSLVAAEEAVVYAFDRGITITGEDVSKKCFYSAEMEAIAEDVLNQANDFVCRRTKLAHHDGVANLKACISAVRDISGMAGSGWKYGAWGLRVSGVLGSAASALGGLAVINFWNPIGWASGVAAGVAVAGTVTSLLFGWLGGKTRKQAEVKKLAAKRASLADVRQNVHAVYDEFSQKVTKVAAKTALDASAKLVLPVIEQALDLRQLAQACADIRLKAELIGNELPAQADPQNLVWETKERCEQEDYPGRPDAKRLLWLGESWVDDREGLLSEHHTEKCHTAKGETGCIDAIFAGAHNAWSQLVSGIEQGAGQTWLRLAQNLLDKDEGAQPMLTELAAIAAEGRPRLYLVGDYNAGKSSFIRRLLLDAGQGTPRELQVRANPTTDHVCQYAWGNIELVDIPGFQSSNENHSETARRAFPAAAAIVYLFQPNLVTGNDMPLRSVLRGDRLLGLVPKAARTVFIINRADELAVDPVDNPRRYKELAERKQVELSQALAERGINVPPEQILCMASDPYGRVGNSQDATRESYDEYRSWDGFCQFMNGYRSIEGELLRTGVDRSILEGGLALLVGLDLSMKTEQASLARQADAVGGMQALVAEQKAAGQRLVAEQRARLTRVVEDHTSSLKDEFFAARDPVALDLKAQRLKRWAEDPALAVELEQWGKNAQGALQSWHQLTTEAMKRRLSSAEFRAAFASPELPGAPDAPGDRQGKSKLKKGFDAVGRWLGGATRDSVYNIGKAVGFKFKPWGAVKLAKTLGKAGAVMGVVGIVWDVADWFMDERRYVKREKLRQEIVNWLEEAMPVVVSSIADGEKNEPGLMRVAEDAICGLDEYLAEISADQDAIKKAIAVFDARRVVYGLLRAEAETLLGGDIWGKHD
nr:GTPase [Gluconobacter kondonii]